MKINYKKLKKVNKRNLKRNYEGFIIERLNALKEIAKVGLIGLGALLLLPFVFAFFLIQVLLMPIKKMILPTFYNIRLRLRLVFKRKKWVTLFEQNKHKVDWIE
jgi:capsular polysaccharide biosynthesis protein